LTAAWAAYRADPARFFLHHGMPITNETIPIIGLNPPATPVWPDDQIMKDWLAGIAAVRETTNRSLDPLEEQSGNWQS
jgi:hypothetical protein